MDQVVLKVEEIRTRLTKLGLDFICVGRFKSLILISVYEKYMAEEIKLALTCEELKRCDFVCMGVHK